MVEDVVRALGYLTLGSRLKRIGERLQAQTQILLSIAGIDIPAAQFPVLAALDRLGPLSVGDLTQALGVTQPGVTRMVGKLEAAGFVKLQRETGDRRVSTITLTGQGRRLVEHAKRAAWPLVEAAVADACAGPSASLLAQVAALEDELTAASLEARAERVRAGGREDAHA